MQEDTNSNLNALTQDFVIELFKACQTDVTFMETCKAHLKYNYLSNEAEKLVWREMVSRYELNEKVPTTAVLAEVLKNHEGVSDILVRMKKIKVSDLTELLDVLQDYIRMHMFVINYDKIGDSWNEGNHEQAFRDFAQCGEDIMNFSLKPASLYDTVYGGFDKRHKERLVEQDKMLSEELGSLTLGIDPLDYYTRGRYSRGDTVLFTAQSGVGKSLVLRWIGMANARRGRTVVHFQAEDTKKLCMQYYDALWTGVQIDDIEKAKISESKMSTLQKNLKKLSQQKGDIFVHAFEEFGSATLLDCRKILEDISQEYGQIDVIIWDYLEKLEPGDGKRYSTGNEGERMRRAAIGDKMKNLAMEFQALGVTATQASSVKRENLNNPDWYMTRENVSEFKAIVNPFSYHFTINQTKDEYEEEIVRIYNDKFRKARSGQLVPIYMNRDNGRFYNKEKTLDILWDKEHNKIKQ